MTIQIITPPLWPSPDDNLENTVRDMLSKAIAAEACMENSQRQLKDLGCNASPDECIRLLQHTSRSLDQIVPNFAPQSDDEVIRESWSTTKAVRARLQSDIRKLESLKTAPTDQWDLM